MGEIAEIGAGIGYVASGIAAPFDWALKTVGGRLFYLGKVVTISAAEVGLRGGYPIEEASGIVAIASFIFSGPFMAYDRLTKIRTYSDTTFDIKNCLTLECLSEKVTAILENLYSVLATVENTRNNLDGHVIKRALTSKALNI